MAVKRKPGKPKSWPVVMAEALILPEHLTVVQGLQLIVANCLAQIRGNQAGVIHGNNPESVHQMRVGLRRLNSALGLFRKPAACPPELLAELAWIRRELGAVRDWDVLVEETLVEIPSAELGPDGLLPLRQAAAAMARKNRLRARKAVMSSRYRQCLLNLEKWIADLDQDGSDALAAPLSAFSREVLAERQDTLHRRGEKLIKANPERRHRARIAAKKMRYATDFFRSWHPSREVSTYLKALAALQDALGWLNDVAVAQELLAQLSGEQPELSYSAGFVQGYLAAASRRKIRQLGRLWERVQRLPVPG